MMGHTAISSILQVPRAHCWQLHLCSVSTLAHPAADRVDHFEHQLNIGPVNSSLAPDHLHT